MGWCAWIRVSSYFGPIAGANWALGRARGEVVQEEVMAALAASEVDRPGRCMEEPVPGVDAVVGATVARERGGMKDLRIGLDGRGTGGEKNIQMPKPSNTPKRSEISKAFMMTSSGCAKRERDRSMLSKL